MTESPQACFWYCHLYLLEQFVVIFVILVSIHYLGGHFTVEPPNIGGRDLVLCGRLSRSWRLTSKTHPSILRLNLLRGVACVGG